MVSRAAALRVLAPTLLFSLFAASLLSQTGRSFLKLSVRDQDDTSRVVIHFSEPLASSVEKSASLLLVKFRTSKDFRIQREGFQSRLVDAIGWSRGSDNYMLSIKVTTSEFQYDSFTIPNPPQLVIDISLNEKGGRRAQKPRGVIESQAREAERHPQNIPPNPSLTSSRPQGMKTVVIDPGHGGMESGARGRSGILEKDLALDISRKLERIIQRNLTFHVILTRDKDVDLSLENRAAIANNNKAFLFISIHFNSSYRGEARGPETFFLSLNATDEEARRLAYLENNSKEFEESIAADSEDEILMILWDMAQAAYLKQSSQLAESIQSQLNGLLGTRNRGIKQAPFKVLTGVACPAVLVEVAFLSNPHDEKGLTDEDFKTRIAQAIYRGLLNFLKASSQD